MTFLKIKNNHPMDGRNLLSILILFLLVLPTVLTGQIKTFIDEYIQRNEGYPSEKVYLHLDRPNYIQGDTIWFKAYSWFGDEQLPDTLSKILYVELLNPKGEVEQKRKLLINNGTSLGEFSLSKAIKAGKYFLRAYTNWMRNPNAGEPFYQAISVNAIDQIFQVECTPVILKSKEGDSLKVNFRFYQVDEAGDLKKEYNHKVDYSLRIGGQVLRTDQILAANTKEQFFKWPLPALNGKDTLATLAISVKDGVIDFQKQFRIPLKERIDLQFFPEGGNLVDGLESKVAFKAIGADGLSRDVKGVIKDENEEVVTLFESSHKGMGCFLLKPETKKKYTAHLEFNHLKYVYTVPKALEKGSVMTVRSTEDGRKSYLTIRYGLKDTIRYVIGSAYGKIRFAASVKVIRDSCRFKIPREMLPEGISRITVLGEDFKSQCERLIYVDQDQRFNVEVKPDSISYGKRSKVTLSIKASTKSGEPVQGDLSLAVVDKDQAESKGGIRGICAYKLLESELKGNIEEADYYFKDDSCINFKALDLLMLTQGYRQFITDTSALNKQKYLPDKGLDVSGIMKLDGHKSKRNGFSYSDYSIGILSTQSNYSNQSKLDSTGGFCFHLPLIIGKPPVFLQTKSPKEKSIYGDILLNDPLSPLPLKSSLIASEELTSVTFESVKHLQEAKKIELSKSYSGAAMHFNLPEMTIKGKNKNWYNFEDEAKKIVDLDSLDPTGKKYKNLCDLLVREFGAREWPIKGLGFTTAAFPCVSTLFKNGYCWPIYVMNGQTFLNEHGGGQVIAPLTQLNFINVSEIKRIMVLPPGKADNYAADYIKLHTKQSLVVIETYKNNSYRGNPA